MYAKHLSVNGLYPPFASGGLWRMWCLLPFAGIRHHPSEAYGGANYSASKDLTNIRHFRAVREGSFIICGGLRKKIYEIEKKIIKIVEFIVDELQLWVILLCMIIERIRKQIETCGMSRYRISKEAGIDKATLCRIMQGGSCKAETADILLEYFDLIIIKDKKRGK